MKKTLLFILFICISIASFAQSNKKYALVQHFTNTRCGVCAGNNPTYYTSIKPYEADVHHISIHPSVPYTSCLLYQANTSEQDVLKISYSVSGTPVFFVNGAAKNLSSVSTSVAANTTKSPIALKVSQTKLNGKINATVEVNSTEIPTSGTYVLYAAAVEKTLNYTSPNGETVHYDVFRKMMSNINGQAITLTATGKQTFTFSTDLLSTWVTGEMYVLAWVQNTTTKEVLNSGSVLDISTSTEEILADTQVLDVYPNPSNNAINFDIKDKTIKVENITILGLDGKNYSNNVEISDNQVNIEALPVGTFLFQLKTKDDKLITKKFVKK
jgi:Outer membrane protein Omp28/Secretion system C-terminal sorting domain